MQALPGGCEAHLTTNWHPQLGPNKMPRNATCSISFYICLALQNGDTQLTVGHPEFLEVVSSV